MDYKIKNDIMSVTISDLGAEPQSIRKTGGEELLHQGTGGIYNSKSPVLFPLIGAFPDSIYTFMGEKYSMPCHGFAADTVFDAVQNDGKSVVFTTCSDSHTESIYPFSFRFSVGYSLDEDTLITEYITENTGKSALYSSVGSHTGYRLNGNLEDYAIRFQKYEHKNRYSVIGNDAAVNQNKLMDGDLLPLNSYMFSKGAQTFSGLCSEYVILEDKSGKGIVKVILEDFKYLTLWSVPGQKYICIEPWSCESTHYAVTNELTEQKDITVVMPGEKNIIKYKIQVL